MADVIGYLYGKDAVQAERDTIIVNETVAGVDSVKINDTQIPIIDGEVNIGIKVNGVEAQGGDSGVDIDTKEKIIAEVFHRLKDVLGLDSNGNFSLKLGTATYSDIKSAITAAYEK